MEAVNIFSIVVIAFLGSFGHCIGMCGGIVVAYTSTKIDSTANKQTQAFAHLLYSIGRVFTYVLLGALFGYLGGVAMFDNLTNGLLLLFAGLMMILIGLSLSGKIKFLTIIEYSIDKNGWYQKLFRKYIYDKSLFSFLVLGMLNGLLPCGLVYFFAIASASTASAFYGALVMLIFGISTIPALFGLGFFLGIFQNSLMRNTMMRFASISVIVFGLWTAYQGFEYLKYPEKSILQCCEYESNSTN